MGSDARVHICYGVILDDDAEYPWDSEEFNGDLEEWWITKVKGFKHSFEIYENDEYINGQKPKQSIIDKYHDEKNDFIKSNPLPFELYDCGSTSYGDCIKVLGLKEPSFYSDWEEPSEIDFSKLVVSEKDKLSIISFCEEYEILYEKEPTWYACCTYG